MPQTSSSLLSAARGLGWEPLLVHVFQETPLEPLGPPAQAAGGQRGSRASPKCLQGRGGGTPSWRWQRLGVWSKLRRQTWEWVAEGVVGVHLTRPVTPVPSLPWSSVPLASAPGWAALPGVCVFEFLALCSFPCHQTWAGG